MPGPYPPRDGHWNTDDRLGTLFVDRYDIIGSLADTEDVIVAARQGRNIVYFPEGTFTRRPGLSGFYLGAFKVAAEASLPVLPGIIRGTRSMLRSDQWFPRWTPLSIQIEDAVSHPEGALPRWCSYVMRCVGLFSLIAASRISESW